jgi:hypothetical protein
VTNASCAATIACWAKTVAGRRVDEGEVEVAVEDLERVGQLGHVTGQQRRGLGAQRRGGGQQRESPGAGRAAVGERVVRVQAGVGEQVVQERPGVGVGRVPGGGEVGLRVGVDHEDVVAVQRERGGQVRDGDHLADAALLAQYHRGDHARTGASW